MNTSKSDRLSDKSDFNCFNVDTIAGISLSFYCRAIKVGGAFYLLVKD